MATLLIAELTGNMVADGTRKALTAALALGSPVHVLVAGSGCTDAAQAAARLSGVEKVLVADGADYAHGLAEPLAALIVSLSGGYDAFVAAATSFGKNVMPRVAALLDVMQISDVTKVLSPVSFERPIYAGNAVQTVETRDAKRVLTVRTTAFSAAADGGQAAIEAVPATPVPTVSRFEGEETARTDRPDLLTAKVVISGGRSLGSAENFTTYIEPVAAKLGAAIGASRAAVDAGYVSNDLQVGQTGKVVAPDLYIAVGISGAIQHLAGMKDSRVIVAINKDPDAPIFQIADYGLVADLFDALPKLAASIER